MGHEVAVSVCFDVQGLQPIEIAVAVGVDDRVLACERRITDDTIETRILAPNTSGYSTGQ